MKLKKGDKVIKFHAFLMYHPECYRKERERVLENTGQLYEHFMDSARSYMDDFRSLIDSEKISDSNIFYHSWGKQLTSVSILNDIIANAERHGSIGFLQSIRMKRKTAKLQNALIALGTSYREDYGAIRIERSVKRNAFFVK